MSLYAPFDGTVVEKQGEEGEVITPSALSTSAGRSAVVTMADLSKMDVEADVGELELSRIALNQPAEISVKSVPGKRYRGRLRQIIPMGDRARSTVKVKVEVLDPDERLFPELQAEVHFLPDKSAGHSDAGQLFLYVPKAAVIGKSGEESVWVVDTKPQVHKRRVDVVLASSDLMRIESGLEEGDQVVLNPPAGLREGELVKVAER
jgi:RND family efflux transporter MFP subunit